MADDRMLKSFISQVNKDGFARLSRFNVVISNPKKMPTTGFNSKDLILLCEKIDLPSLSIATNDVQVYGESRAMPYQKMYEKVSLSFYVDMKMDVKKYFDKWMQLIIHPKSKNQYYYDDYVTIMEIIVGNIAEDSVYKLKLHECYPTNISTVGLDYGARDIMRLNVTMNYKYYDVEEYQVSGSGSFIEYDYSKPIDITERFSVLQQSAVNYPTVQSLIATRITGFVGYTANTVNNLVNTLTSII